MMFTEEHFEWYTMEEYEACRLDKLPASIEPEGILPDGIYRIIDGEFCRIVPGIPFS